MRDMHSRLRKARIDAGYATATAAIAHFGWKSSTYRAHENGQNYFDGDAAKIYALAFGTSPAWLLVGEPGQLGQNSVTPGSPFLAKPVTNFSEKLHRIPISGHVAAGEWHEVALQTLMENSWTESPFPPDPGFPIEAQFDLRVSGTSLNRFADEGEVLRCIDLRKAGVDLRDGDLCIIERKRDGDLREVSARRLRKLGERLEFWCESKDPVWENVVIVKEPSNGLGGDIKVLAKVLWKYRKA